MILPRRPTPTAHDFAVLARTAGTYDLLKAITMRDNPPLIEGFAGAYYPVWFLGVLNYALADLIERMAGPEPPA